MADETEVEVPETDAQITALEKALAGAYLARLEQVKAVIDGPVGQAFKEALTELQALKLPPASGARANIQAMTMNMDVMLQGLEAEITNQNNVANPPPPADLLPVIPSAPEVQ